MPQLAAVETKLFQLSSFLLDGTQIDVGKLHWLSMLCELLNWKLEQ